MAPKQRWVLGLASLGSFMVALDVLVVTTALSTIHRDLGASLAALEWTVNAYSLTFAVLLLTGSALGDRYGRRRMYAVGLGLFTVASAACALAPGIGTLIAARAVQGAGAALVLPLALTQLSAAFPPERRGAALGIFSGVTGLAVFSGPFIGGAVTQGLAWQWIFWVNVPVGIVAIALVWARLPESRGSDVTLDITGVVLVTGGSLGVVWALVRGNDVGWASTEVLLTLIGGAVLLVAFAVWEARTKTAMLPMRFFRVRAFTTANTANFCLYASMYGTLFLLTQYLQNALGYGPAAAGLRLMAWTATLMVCGPIAGNLVDRLGERRFMSIGLFLNTIGLGWLALLASPGLSYGAMVAPLVLSGCGISMAMPAAQKSGVGAVRPQEIGKASGAVTVLRIFGGVLGIAVLTAVFARVGGFASAATFSRGFGAALFVAAAVSLIGSLSGLGMPGRVRPVPPTPAMAALSTAREAQESEPTH
jgi:EmrB/QacA subfamily drug resistance transporter